jgi:hypothetical protein
VKPSTIARAAGYTLEQIDTFLGKLGKPVVITSGLLRALQGKGIEDIAEIRYTDRKAIIKGFRGGKATSADFRSVIPEIQYLTNDAWELVSGLTQNDLGYPLLSMMTEPSPNCRLTSAIMASRARMSSLPAEAKPKSEPQSAGHLPVAKRA